MKALDGSEVDPALVETCTKCGMVANLDPWFHASRYGHQPVVRRGTQILVHDGSGAFRPYPQAGY